MEDEKIIALFFGRDEAAVREIDRKYGKLCHKVANNILDSPADAEECVNDTYMHLWNTIPPTEPNNLRAYIIKAVRNLSLNRKKHLNAKKRFVKLDVPLSEMENVLPDNSINPDAGDDYILTALNEFLAALNDETCAIFVRKYWFFDSVSDIALRFGISESKVKVTLYRTREKLKKFLAEKGIKV